MDQFLTLKGQKLDQFLTLQHIYIGAFAGECVELPIANSEKVEVSSSNSYLHPKQIPIICVGR